MEYITMSKRELEQSKIFEKLRNDEITQREAALRLDLSVRWVRKKFQRYLQYGDCGLIHKNRGRPSKRRWNEQEKALALDLLQSEWQGFGPTFAVEKLEELKGIEISKETLRTAMIQAHIWEGKKRKLKYRKQRERRVMVGLMIQLDGSPHDWFEGRGPCCTLLVFIDDATSRLMWLEFVVSESYDGVMGATKSYIQKYGRPHEFYVDFGKVFSVNLNNAERIKKTQWERALEEIGTRARHAHSPQAKGRVERSNRTLQDRLIKEMRLANISSIDEANRFLKESNFIEHHNQKFAVPAAQIGDAHRSSEHYKLDDIFCLRYTRVLANDNTIRFLKRVFQLGRNQKAFIRPKDIITVSVHLDGSISLSVRGIKLSFCELNSRPQKEPKEKRYVYKPNKVSENSRRWKSGLSVHYQPRESRMKPAAPAVEAK